MTPLAKSAFICVDDSRYNAYLVFMALKDDIQLSKPFPNQGVQAFLTLGRTLIELMAEPEALLKQHGISATQHNVLRILNGSAGGLPLGQIAERMVARDPDLTRLIDRMERAKLVERARDTHDRRVVLARITRKGKALCKKLDAPVTDIHARQFKGLGPKKTKQLIALLEELREHNRSEQ
jgi:DNA-binding MarR family transcriptional regulator